MENLPETQQDTQNHIKPVLAKEEVKEDKDDIR